MPKFFNKNARLPHDETRQSFNPTDKTKFCSSKECPSDEIDNVMSDLKAEAEELIAKRRQRKRVVEIAC